MTEALNATVKHALVARNLKGINLLQDNYQQIISWYANDTSSTVKAKETNLANPTFKLS